MPQTPAQQAAMAAAFREYLSVHPALDLPGHLKDEISRALVGVAADFIDALPMPKNPHHPATEPAEHVVWANGAGAVLGAVHDALQPTTTA
ncbi:hypothetical protein [Comamonas terrigena]|jgi:hypothetical protein|uniref:hypothetical protein n=1 Tax=Comamonas terrigena TaxID=32013 RepID=UPI00244C56E3|nr:hypothetical protein [Comamonas terrigena]MDH0051020.1 hypothetical protein [Comamonas terrigena]MDH0513491.1 hypothetical protein [Comamonas terrigena]MDH1092965.1 hypothetical protein [Comamonas terrigena]MDH1501369.1 hypothetical protein [Comamonas terrigena]